MLKRTLLAVTVALLLPAAASAHTTVAMSVGTGPNSPEAISGLTEPVAVSGGVALLKSGHVDTYEGGIREVPSISEATAISRDYALLKNGRVKTWRGTEAATEVSGLTAITAISAGHEYALAIHEGHVYAWGNNYEGQLGDGNTTASSTPVEVTGITEAVAVAAGDSTSLAVLRNGTIKSWGSNGNGQLGDGGKGGYSDVPVTVSGITTATAVAGAYDEEDALLANGTVEQWGYRYAHGYPYEEAFSCRGVSRDTPQENTGLTEVASIAPNLARLHNGTLRTFWGDPCDATGTVPWAREATSVGVGAAIGTLLKYPFLPGVEHVQGVAIGAAGNVWVREQGKVSEYTQGREYLRSFTSPVLEVVPNGIAANSSGDVYVTNALADLIEEFGPNGEPIRQWETTLPTAIAIDPSGNVWTASLLANPWRIAEYSPTGTYIRGFPETGWCFGLAVSSSTVYAVSYSTQKINEFTTSGTLTRSIEATMPFGVALGGGNLYVTEPNRVQEFTPEGSLLSSFGSAGTVEPGVLNAPRGVSVNAYGTVYVADYGNGRVTEWQPGPWTETLYESL